MWTKRRTPDRAEKNVCHSCTGVAVLTRAMQKAGAEPVCVGVKRRLQEVSPMVEVPKPDAGDGLLYVVMGYSLHTTQMARAGLPPVVKIGYSMRIRDTAKKSESNAVAAAAANLPPQPSKHDTGAAAAAALAAASALTEAGPPALPPPKTGPPALPQPDVPHRHWAQALSRSIAEQTSGVEVDWEKISEHWKAIEEQFEERIESGVPPHLVGDTLFFETPLRKDAKGADGGGNNKTSKDKGGGGGGEDERRRSDEVNSKSSLFSNWIDVSAIARGAWGRMEKSMRRTAVKWEKSMRKQANYMGTFAKKWTQYIYRLATGQGRNGKGQD